MLQVCYPSTYFTVSNILFAIYSYSSRRAYLFRFEYILEDNGVFRSGVSFRQVPAVEASHEGVLRFGKPATGYKTHPPLVCKGSQERRSHFLWRNKRSHDYPPNTWRPAV